MPYRIRLAGRGLRLSPCNSFICRGAKAQKEVDVGHQAEDCPRHRKRPPVHARHVFSARHSPGPQERQHPACGRIYGKGAKPMPGPSKSALNIQSVVLTRCGNSICFNCPFLAVAALRAFKDKLSSLVSTSESEICSSKRSGNTTPGFRTLKAHRQSLEDRRA